MGGQSMKCLSKLFYLLLLAYFAERRLPFLPYAQFLENLAKNYFSTFPFLRAISEHFCLKEEVPADLFPEILLHGSPQKQMVEHLGEPQVKSVITWM